MSARFHIHADDLVLYALQSLSTEEAAAIAEHLQECAACRGEVAALQGGLAALAVTSKLDAPPPMARQRLAHQIGREKKVVLQAPPVAAPAAGAAEDEVDTAQQSAPDTYRSGGETQPKEDKERGRQSGGTGAWKLLGWMGWVLAAGGLMAAGRLYQQREAMRSSMMAANGEAALLAADGAKGQAVIDALRDPTAMRVVVTQRSGGSRAATGQPEATGRAIYVPSKGTLIFLANSLEPLPQEKAYELWLIRADGHNPVAAGTFQPDARGDASVILPSLPKGVIARAFVVTIEAAGGSAQPTLPILLSGASF